MARVDHCLTFTFLDLLIACLLHRYCMLIRNEPVKWRKECLKVLSCVKSECIWFIKLNTVVIWIVSLADVACPGMKGMFNLLTVIHLRVL